MTQKVPSFPLYDHIKRPQWGPAMLLWERDHKRGYLFEDGALRVIAEPYYELLKLNQNPDATLAETFQRQLARMDVAVAGEINRARTGVRSRFTLDEQAQLLLGEFPDGFSGDAWQKKHRGTSGKKALKRHRDPVVLEAREVLSASQLTQASEEAEHRELWERFCKVLRGTDLVPLREVKVLEQNLDHVRAPLTNALRGMLETQSAEDSEKDDEAFKTHFTEFVKELAAVTKGKKPSWSLVTALLALHDPKEHFCVNPSSLSYSLKWMKRPAVHRSKPNALDYVRARAFAHELSEDLKQLGVVPTDLLDVYDFIKLTTTPAARKRLEMIGNTPLLGVTQRVAKATPAGDAPSAGEPEVATPDETENADSEHHDEAA